jgi:hypothetical protein
MAQAAPPNLERDELTIFSRADGRIPRRAMLALGTASVVAQPPSREPLGSGLGLAEAVEGRAQTHRTVVREGAMEMNELVEQLRKGVRTMTYTSTLGQGSYKQVWRVAVDGTPYALTTQRFSNANIKRRKLNAQVTWLDPVSARRHTCPAPQSVNAFEGSKRALAPETCLCPRPKMSIQHCLQSNRGAGQLCGGSTGLPAGGLADLHNCCHRKRVWVRAERHGGAAHGGFPADRRSGGGRWAVRDGAELVDAVAAHAGERTPLHVARPHNAHTATAPTPHRSPTRLGCSLLREELKPDPAKRRLSMTSPRAWLVLSLQRA